MTEKAKTSWYTELKNWFKVTEQCNSPIRIAGHTFPEKAEVQGNSLVLNGAGLRSIKNNPVYAAALYLPELTQRADTASALLGARRFELCILIDAVPAEYIGSLRDGIARNVNATSQDFIKEELLQVEEVMRNNNVSKGDVIDIDWIPGVGSIISCNGKVISPVIRGKALYDAVLSIWLGTDSLEDELRKSLLHSK